MQFIVNSLQWCPIEPPLLCHQYSVADYTVITVLQLQLRYKWTSADVSIYLVYVYYIHVNRIGGLV